MKKIIVILVILFSGLLIAQQQPDDLQKVKDALVVQVLKTQDLEKQNANLISILNGFGEDVKNTKTITQLDSVRIKWGIVKEEKKERK